MLGVIVHLEDPICDQALTSWLMSWDIASIYPHNFPSSWCHLYCEVHKFLLQQSTPTTWCCHPRASRLGWFSSACKPPPFSSKHNHGHCGQTVLILFHQTRGHFSNKYDLCPHVQLQTVVWLFMAVLEQWLLPCWAAFQVMSIYDLFLLWLWILLYRFPPASSQCTLLLFSDWFALFAPK